GALRLLRQLLPVLQPTECAVAYPGRLEPDARDVRRTPDAHQDAVAHQLPRVAAYVVVHHHLAAAPLGAGDPRAMDQAHAVGRHAPFDDRRRVGVLPGQDVRIYVDHRDVRPEPAEGLRPLRT